MKLSKPLYILIATLLILTLIIIAGIYIEAILFHVNSGVSIDKNTTNALPIISATNLTSYQNSHYNLQLNYPKKLTVTLIDGEGYEKEYKGGVDAKSHSSISFIPTSAFLKEICPEAAQLNGQVWVNLLGTGYPLTESERASSNLVALFKQYPNNLSYFGTTENTSYIKKGNLELLQLKYGENPRLHSVVIRTAKYNLLNLSVADNDLCPAIYPIFQQMVASIQAIN